LTHNFYNLNSFRQGDKIANRDDNRIFRFLASPKHGPPLPATIAHQNPALLSQKPLRHLAHPVLAQPIHKEHSLPAPDSGHLQNDTQMAGQPQPIAMEDAVAVDQDDVWVEMGVRLGQPFEELQDRAQLAEGQQAWDVGQGQLDEQRVLVELP
jgi:hypothetical protein